MSCVLQRLPFHLISSCPLCFDVSGKLSNALLKPLLYNYMYFHGYSRLLTFSRFDYNNFFQFQVTGCVLVDIQVASEPRLI